MNADSHYVIGQAHLVCQDYARAKTADDGKSGYAILCDGCSSSPDSDIGARLLALEMVRICKASQFGPAIDFETVATFAAANAEQQAIMHGLHPTCIDATLYTLRVVNNCLFANVWGDGVLVVQQHDRVDCWETDFPSGYPAYPSYCLSTVRNEEFVKRNSKDVIRGRGVIYATSVVQWAAVFSDGVFSFKRPVENGWEPVPWEEVVAELTAFKNFQGKFVTRRMKRFFKDAAKKGWCWDDDVSMAAIHFGSQRGLHGRPGGFKGRPGLRRG